MTIQHNNTDALLQSAWEDAPIAVTAEVNFIWSIATKLRGTYSSDKYKEVIIPMTIIRRFECALTATKDRVVAAYEKNPRLPIKALENISGHQFYNTSRFTLEKLLDDAPNIAANLKKYIQSFSPNVQEILTSAEKGLDFNKQIDKMDKNDRLYGVVQAFSELDLSVENIDSIKMGYIFEELIRKFSENAEAGDHYTGRDIIKVMVSILMAEGADDVFDEGKVVTILDQACGTGGMLSTAWNYIRLHNSSADVRLFGQEVNPESYSLCMAEMLIKGQDADNIRYQDTMKADCFEDIKVRFVLENPPFGTPWGGKDAASGVESAVMTEHDKPTSRWGAGLPGAGDMQMLFLQSAVDKMDEDLGRAAIIHNASPLFAGGVSSGESQIRRWLLQEDLIEAIIALPSDLFYNTNIGTYIWVLSKNKQPAREGKIQLIDASNMGRTLRKSLGKKRIELEKKDRERITRLYSEFEENDFSIILENEDLLYREYAVMQPMQRNYSVTDERIEQLINKGKLNSLHSPSKVLELQAKEGLTAAEQKSLDKHLAGQPVYEAIIDTLRANTNEQIYGDINEFLPVLKEITSHLTVKGKALSKSIIDNIANGLSVIDKTATVQKKRNGEVIYDPETRQTEKVPFNERIDEYILREVKPHVPDGEVFFEEVLTGKNKKIKTGAEIPFSRFFYKYEAPEDPTFLASELITLEDSVSDHVTSLFKRSADTEG